MNSDINFLLFISLVVFMIISWIFNNKRKRGTEQFLKSLQSDYPNLIKITGRIEFSKIRILMDVDLNIIYSEDDLLIYGFDYYNDRNCHFIFHTNRYQIVQKENRVLHYLITNIDILNNEKIVFKTKDNYELILRFRNYGVEKKQLKETKFLKLINSLSTELKS
ncbi:hypothetical protein [uncultured Winogradskyella sp.]|uniref:hypothetical protein n=1 Tax=uncultured Winogradskyella sp. TaxID=395353 RepID=UPI002629E40A|nr:hypothetical protein [uncultured Winogradskyella sp.]